MQTKCAVLTIFLMRKSKETLSADFIYLSTLLFVENFRMLNAKISVG